MTGLDPPRELLAVVGSDLGGSDQVVDNLEYWVEIKWSLIQQNVVSGCCDWIVLNTDVYSF